MYVCPFLQAHCLEFLFSEITESLSANEESGTFFIELHLPYGEPGEHRGPNILPKHFIYFVCMEKHGRNLCTSYREMILLKAF